MSLCGDDNIEIYLHWVCWIVEAGYEIDALWLVAVMVRDRLFGVVRAVDEIFIRRQVDSEYIQ